MYLLRVIDCIAEKIRVIDVSIMTLYSIYRVCQKSDTLFNYVNIMPYKLKKTRYLCSLNTFNVCY